jgi:hypothetical protein
MSRALFAVVWGDDLTRAPKPSGYKCPYGPAGNRLTDAQKHECEKLGLGVTEYLNTRRRSRR